MVKVLSRRYSESLAAHKTPHSREVSFGLANVTSISWGGTTADLPGMEKLLFHKWFFSQWVTMKWLD